jgi:hypothetical protein
MDLNSAPPRVQISAREAARLMSIKHSQGYHPVSWSRCRNDGVRICFADDSYHDYLMCATCDHGAWWHFVSYQLTKPLCRRCPRKSKYHEYIKGVGDSKT